MARAKSTDRSEARRRHRAILAAQAAEAEAAESTSESDAAPAPEASNRPSRATDRRVAAGQQRAPVRPSVLDALRTSFRPANVREDLRALPDITLHSRAIWLPAVLMLVGAVAALVAGTGVVRQVVIAILYPTPMLPSFLSGALAPRAAYLAGGLTGIIGGVIVFGLALLTAVIPSASGDTVAPTAQEAAGLFVYVLVSGLLFGIVFGGFASFYRRFLSMSSTNRNQPKRPQKNGRAPARGR